MIKNYFKTAIRNFRSNKVFSSINILGLAIGISASLVIFLIIQYDLGFDKFQQDRERIYRIVTNSKFSGNEYPNSGVPLPMADAVRSEVTGIDITAGFNTWNEDAKVSIPKESGNDPLVFKKQTRIIFADKNYFDIIHYKWLAGSPATALTQPYQVVLTQSNARLYFPNTSNAAIIGKEIAFNDTLRTTVTGIVEDITEKTDFTFKTFLSRATLGKTGSGRNLDRWDNVSSSTQLMVKLSKGADPSKVTTQVEKLFAKNDKKEPGDNSSTTHWLQPLSDLHFNARYDNFDQRMAHKPTLYGLLSVALFLLILGCINFINLTTANATQRAKEIGIRKTLGSSRKQLISQFLSETFLLSLVATFISIIITPLLLKAFSDFIPPELHFSFKQPSVILFLLILTAVVSLLAGFYPALILSSYRPVAVLKNQVLSSTGSSRNVIFRKTLTVSQFVIAQFLIIATVIVVKQINFSLSKDMGFKKDALVYFSTSYYDTSKTNKQVLLEKLKAIPEIASISLSTAPPSSENTWSTSIKYKDGKKEIDADVQVKLADTNYIHLYNIKLIAGKNIPYRDTIDQVLINETYAKQLGFKQPQEAIGKYVEWDNKQDMIVGVVADFNQRSLHESVQPLVMSSHSRQQRTFNIALQPQNAAGTLWKDAISKIERSYKELYPENDFELSFFDESIKKYYKAEQNISSLLMWATGLAIFISCLGLLGLVIYTTNQKTKEIGIRKVIGASISQIIVLLSKDFIKLIMIAFVISIPIVWFAANKWLQNFAYKTTINVWIFLVGGMIMLGMALIVLLLRTYKAAIANPVKSLRSE